MTAIDMIETPAPRQTLAMRLAERNRQRTLRAERLAKLRSLGPEGPVAEMAPEGPVAEMTPEGPVAEMAPEAPVAEMIPEAPVAGMAPEGLAVEMIPEGLAAEMAPEGMAEAMAPVAPMPEILAEMLFGPVMAPEGPAAVETPETVAETVAGTVAKSVAETIAESVADRVAESLAGSLAGPVAEAMPVLPAVGPLAEPVAAVIAGPGAARDREADAALEDFLRALTGGVTPAAALPETPGEILHFQRPVERATVAERLAERMTPAASGLEQLPGAGPGLVWALGRAGLDSLAAIAPLAPAELADRLGPIGRLVPAERWVATARAAVAAGPVAAAP